MHNSLGIMDLIFKCLVFILFAFNRYIEGQRLFASKQKTLWGKNNCSLAVPNIIFNDGISIKTDEQSLLPVSDNSLWIGMFKASLSYAYVGCNNMDGNKTFPVQSISECRWRTGCNTFAVRKIGKNNMECTCFVSSNITSLSECKSDCEELGNKYKCGSDKSPYFSVYTVENETDWTNIQTGSTEKWHNAVEDCFNKNGFPGTHIHLKFANITSSQSYWTGIMRTDTILRNDEHMKTYFPKQYAYVILNGKNKFEVKFDLNSSAERRSLCTNEISLTTPSTTNTDLTAKTTNPSTTIVQVTDVQTSDIITLKTTMTTNSHSPTSSTMVQSSIANEKNGKENKSLGQQHVSVVGISIGVSACVLLVVVIVVLCFLKRRGMLRCFDAKSYLDNKDGTSHQDITPAYMKMDTKVKPKAFPNHAYLMQEQFPPITANEPNLESRSDLQDHLNERSENVYNTVDQQIEDYDDINPADVLQMNDYDSTLNNRNDCGSSEETYNYLNEEMCQMPTADNGYGHCGKQINVGETNMAVEQPDAENPIMTNESVILENMPYTPLQAIKQGDNVYNTVHRQAEEYDHINPADVKQQVDNYDSTSELPKNVGNKEETYNKLNEQIRRMPNAENVYGRNAEQKHETDYNTTAGTLSSHADKSVFGQDYDKINKIW
ncbi:uncharacterized protein LOC128234726 isoform X2 [Mya arenaria]|uniref:uncharacterized protein LOC128234726 isoform X2 n=1 Tax=Mya arenaria TaxID=6604 RepID=UPI0022E7ADD8|nr:uncharacterized protein LOC128234726 isoform X2 [Mya arenaria]